MTSISSQVGHLHDNSYLIIHMPSLLCKKYIYKCIQEKIICFCYFSYRYHRKVYTYRVVEQKNSITFEHLKKHYCIRVQVLLIKVSKTEKRLYKPHNSRVTSLLHKMSMFTCSSTVITFKEFLQRKENKMNSASFFSSK